MLCQRGCLSISPLPPNCFSGGLSVTPTISQLSKKALANGTDLEGVDRDARNVEEGHCEEEPGRAMLETMKSDPYFKSHKGIFSNCMHVVSSYMILGV